MQVRPFLKPVRVNKYGKYIFIHPKKASKLANLSDFKINTIIYLTYITYLCYIRITIKTNTVMKNTSNRMANILLAAIKLGFEIDTTDSFESVLNEAEDFIMNNATPERHECEVSTSGHNQYVNFGDFHSSGHIVDFSAHWHESPETEVDHESFVDDDGNLIQLFYKVGETDYNAPDGFYYSKKLGRHVAEKVETEEQN